MQQFDSDLNESTIQDIREGELGKFEYRLSFRNQIILVNFIKDETDVMIMQKMPLYLRSAYWNIQEYDDICIQEYNDIYDFKYFHKDTNTEKDK